MRLVTLVPNKFLASLLIRGRVYGHVLPHRCAYRIADFQPGGMHKHFVGFHGNTTETFTETPQRLSLFEVIPSGVSDPSRVL